MVGAAVGLFTFFVGANVCAIVGIFVGLKGRLGCDVGKLVG